MFSDPTLTVENLIGVMEKVTLDEDRRRMVWFFVLEMDHQVPFSFDEIYIKYTTAKEKTHALADIYVNIRPESSWQHLLQTLYDRNELEAAKEAKAFLQQNRGTNYCDTDHIIPYSRKIWRELIWWIGLNQREKNIFNLADFNLANRRVRSSHTPNLLHVYACLRLLREVACCLISPVRLSKLYGVLRTEAS